MKSAAVPLFTFFLFLFSSNAQSTSKTLEFKKGEILDILLLTNAPDFSAEFERYKKTAFPVAFEYSYRPQPSFAVKKLSLGTNFPEAFIFGKWESLEKREGFLKNIAKRVPDFHEQRRNLWKYFGLTYYVMPKNITFEISSSNHNVVTSFWQKDVASFKPFIKEFKSQITKHGGKIIVQLNEGKSPLGYFYSPDAMLIISWNNETDFKDFSKAYPLSAFSALENVHQFVIE